MRDQTSDASRRTAARDAVAHTTVWLQVRMGKVAGLRLAQAVQTKTTVHGGLSNTKGGMGVLRAGIISWEPFVSKFKFDTHDDPFCSPH